MKNGNNENGNEFRHELQINSKTAAAYLEIHPKTLELMARKGEVPATKSGRSWKYLPSL